MSEKDWHADDRLLSGYVAGALDLPTAMSLEQHVMRCARCRQALSGQVDPGPLDRVWRGVEAQVEGSLRQRWRRTRARWRAQPGRPRMARTGSAPRADWLPGSSWGGRPGTVLAWYGGTALAGVFTVAVAGALVLGGATATVPGPTASLGGYFGAEQAKQRCVDLGPARPCLPRGDRVTVERDRQVPRMWVEI